MSLKTKIEESLFSDQKSLNATLCVIRAIYKLSYNHYLQVNALSESDLNKEDGAYRQLTSWPSQSRFIFSLEQMRDAYERLGNNPIAKQLLTVAAAPFSATRPLGWSGKKRTRKNWE